MTKYLAWILIFAFATSLADAQVSSDEPIVLRDLSLIKTRKIRSFDVDGILLDDQTKLGWDQVYSALHEDPQFKVLHEQISLPLYRLKTRLKNGDFVAALPLADRLRPIFSKTKGPNYQLVLLVELMGRIENSQRTAAAVAWFRLNETGQDMSSWAKMLPANRLNIDPNTGIWDRLLPVFFDAKGCQKAVADLKLDPFDEERKLSSGLLVYAASLAAKAGDPELAGKYRDILAEQDPRSVWLDVVKMQVAIANRKPVKSKLASVEYSRTPDVWAVGHFLDGSEKINANTLVDQQRGALTLLKIPAIAGSQFPELSAASLATCADWEAARKHSRNSKMLEEEIRRNYSSTHFGKKYSAETKPTDSRTRKNLE